MHAKFVKRIKSRLHIPVILTVIPVAVVTGFFLLEKVSSAVETWDFNSDSDYSFNLAEIEVSGGAAKLVAPNDWYDPSWGYRKEVTIDNSSNPSSISNYQIRLDISYEVEMKSDFSDLVFTESDGQSNIDFWVEAYDASTSAIVWVEVPLVSANTIETIFFYYGNSSATSLSNGANTFILFDDFESYSLGNFTANATWNVYSPANTEAKIVEEGYTKYGYYNGSTTSGVYAIGAYIADNNGFITTKYDANPILEKGTGFESSLVKDPFALKIGDTYYLYYAGYNGSIYAGIGLATSKDGLHFDKYSGNPVISASQSYESKGVAFPTVYYDSEEIDPNKLFKMLYSCTASSRADNFQYEVCYAYSADGLSWNKYTSNPVMTFGASGEWDDYAVGNTANIIDMGSHYYMQYSGRPDLSSPWQTGAVTFSSFEGAFTRDASNPFNLNRPTSLQTLTLQTNSGTKTVTVADTSTFQVNEPVYLRDTGTLDELNRIESIDSPTQITLQNNASRNYPIGSTLRSWAIGSITPRTATYDGAGNWTVFLTLFQPYGTSGLIRESTGYATSADGLNWSLSNTNSPIIPWGSSSSWEAISAENITILDGSQTTPTNKSLRLRAFGTNTTIHVTTKNTSLTNFVFESKLKYAKQANVWLQFRGQNYNMANPNGYFAIKQTNNHYLQQYNSGWTAGATSVASISNSEYVRSVITANGNSQNWDLYNYDTNANIFSKSSSYSAFASGYVGFTNYSNTVSTQSEAIVDWMFVRTFSNFTPAHSISTPQTQFTSGSYLITPNTPLTGLIETVSGFTETASKGSGEIKYQISNDNGSTWYWHDSSTWSAATLGYAHSNTATEVDTNIDTFALNGSILFRAYLFSNGSSQVELDEVSITYDLDSTAPSITLSSLSPDPYNSQNFDITGNATDSLSVVTSVEYQLDSTLGVWSSCLADDSTFDELNEDFTCNLAGIAEGVHTIYVRSSDSSANTTLDINAATDSFTIDVSTPILTLSTYSPDPTSSQDLDFTGNVDDTYTNVVSVEFQLDSTAGSWNSCSADDGNFDELIEAYTCELTGISEGTHTIFTRATDDANNTISDLNAETDTFSVDVSAPVINIDAYAPDPTTNTDISITGAANDSISTVNIVEYQLDSTLGSWNACIADDSAFDENAESFSCNLLGVAEGSHTVYVRSIDSLGNTLADVNALTDSFIVDTSEPILILDAYSPDPTSNQDLDFTGNVNDTYTNVVSVEFQLDSTAGSWNSCNPDDGNFDELNEAYTCSLTGVSEGIHTVYVRAADLAGNTISDLNAATDNFTISLSAPTITINEYLPDPTNSQNLDFSGVATDLASNIFLVEFQLDSTTGSWSSCDPLDGLYDEFIEDYLCSLSNVSEGSHTIYTRATNDNTTTTLDINAATDSFTVDISAPQINLTAFSPDPTNDQDLNLVGNVIDSFTEISAVEYQLDSTIGTWSDCDSDDGTFDELSEDFTCTLTGISEGTHTIFVRASDTLLNTTQLSNFVSDEFSIDLTPPSVEVKSVASTSTSITILTTNTLSFQTTDTTPTISGQAEALASIRLSFDSMTNCDTQANASGIWSCTLTNALAIGDHSVVTKATDSASNVTTLQAFVIKILSSTQSTNNQNSNETDNDTNTNEDTILDTDAENASSQLEDLEEDTLKRSLTFKLTDLKGNLLRAASVTLGDTTFLTNQEGEVTFVTDLLSSELLITYDGHEYTVFFDENTGYEFSIDLKDESLLIAQNIWVFLLLLLLILIILIACWRIYVNLKNIHQVQT